jgi:hypothetical protein
MKNVINNVISYLYKRDSLYLLNTNKELLQDTTKLGRWKIDYNNNIINCKIDQANEDHCGCCVNEFDKEKDNYLVPYCIQ